MPRLYLDWETRNTVNLKQVGLYAYADHPDAEIILGCYALDDGPVRTWWPDRPGQLVDLLQDPANTVVCHGAGFERVMLERCGRPRYGLPALPVERFDCTMARALRMALPRSLEGAAQALGLGVEKDKPGHALMLRMSKPRRLEPDGTPVWWDDADRLARLEQYCQQDVIVTRELDRRLVDLRGPERACWELDQQMNDRGVRLDLNAIAITIRAVEQARLAADERITELTNGAVSAVSNVSALKRWANIDSLTKKNSADVLATTDDPDIAEAIQLRMDTGKSSVAKLQKMLLVADGVGRARGNSVYHAASTGRFAGQGIQLQNLVRETTKSFEQDLAALRYPRLAELELGPVLPAVSRMLRGMLIADPGHELMFGDWAAIEARGVAWLAGCQRLVRAFASGAKIYEVMAGRIFDRPAEAIGKDSFERFLGKQTVLGCGYGMGAARFQQQCKDHGQEVSEVLAARAVNAFRTAYPEIPALWRMLGQTAISALLQGQPAFFPVGEAEVIFHKVDRFLRLRLPSGRNLFYANPRLEDGELVYDAVNPKTKQWGAERTWGGKLVENIVQGFCRDVLRDALLQLEGLGFRPILSTHDEIVCEPRAGADIEAMRAVMSTTPAWARGLPLAVEIKRGTRYGK